MNAMRSGHLRRSARSGSRPSLMTGLMDRMERDGLVGQRPDPADRRVLKIFLTDAGAGTGIKICYMR